MLEFSTSLQNSSWSDPTIEFK